jgi:hypothetical protein
LRNAPQVIKVLWTRKFFENIERSFEEIKSAIGNMGCNPSDKNLYMALERAEYLTKRGTKGNYRYIQKYAYKGVTLDAEVFSEQLINDLGSEFEIEIKDLKINYGLSGNCTAFLLRKILEKLIFLTFSRHNLASNLKDKNGEFVGLKTMINLASTNSVQGKPFLMPKTAKEIEGIKFLGDTSAHNPLTNVDMKTIMPQMPYIITAFEELSKKLRI